MFCGIALDPKSQLDILRENGMRAIVTQNKQGLKYKDDPVIMGWIQKDEPDNAQKQQDGSWGRPVDPAVIIDRYKEMMDNDPSRPVLLNLGETVANEKSKNRGMEQTEMIITGMSRCRYKALIFIRLWSRIIWYA